MDTPLLNIFGRVMNVSSAAIQASIHKSAETKADSKRTLSEDDVSVKRNKTNDVAAICKECITNVSEMAITLNHVACMRAYLETTKISKISLQWMMYDAAKHWDTEILRLLFEQGPDINTFSMNLTECAAGYGNIEGIKLALPHFSWGYAMAAGLAYALSTDDFTCVNYLRAEGCPIREEILHRSNIPKHIDKLWIAIKFLEDVNYNWSVESHTTILTLLEHGKIDIVEYLRQKGCPWPRYDNLLEQFAGKHYNNREVFLYIYKTKPKWTGYVLASASKVLGMLEFIYKHCKKDITEEDEATYYPDRLCVPFNDPVADTVNVCMTCMARLIANRVDKWLVDMLQLKDHTIRHCFTCSLMTICYANIWLNAEYKDKFSPQVLSSCVPAADNH
jgi:hypothetical protein